MGAVIYLDTHVVVWLYAGQIELLPASVMLRLEAADLKISPIVSLELEHLHEIGRLLVPGVQVVRDLALQIGLVTCDLPFATVIECAVQQAWTRDPFDRIIVGQAVAAGKELVTKDRGDSSPLQPGPLGIRVAISAGRRSAQSRRRGGVRAGHRVQRLRAHRGASAFTSHGWPSDSSNAVAIGRYLLRAAPARSTQLLDESRSRSAP